MSHAINQSINQSVIKVFFFLRLKHSPSCYFPKKKVKLDTQEMSSSCGSLQSTLSGHSMWILNYAGHRRIDTRYVTVSHTWTHSISMKKNIRS